MSEIPAANGKVAVVLGGTGAVGKCIIPHLLINGWTVYTLGRRPWDLTMSSNFKQKEMFSGSRSVADFESAGRLKQFKADTGALPQLVLDNAATLKAADALFNAFGTTAAAAGSSAEFIRIDHDIPVAITQNLKRIAPDLTHSSLISSSGACSYLPFLYPKTKGRIEDAFKAVGFKTLSIYRPGFLDRGADSGNRTGEKIARWFSNGIDVDVIATAVVKDATDRMTRGAANDADRVHVYGNKDIERIAAAK